MTLISANICMHGCKQWKDKYIVFTHFLHYISHKVGYRRCKYLKSYSFPVKSQYQWLHRCRLLQETKFLPWWIQFSYTSEISIMLEFCPTTGTHSSQQRFFDTMDSYTNDTLSPDSLELNLLSSTGIDKLCHQHWNCCIQTTVALWLLLLLL